MGQSYIIRSKNSAWAFFPNQPPNQLLFVVEIKQLPLRQQERCRTTAYRKKLATFRLRTTIRYNKKHRFKTPTIHKRKTS